MLELRPYQNEGADFLVANKYALLADAMRLGKSPQAIVAAHNLRAERVIVACPAIATEQWRAEWRKWYDYLCAPIMPRLTITSYDMLRRYPQKFLNRNYDIAIIDECHFAKNPDAKRTKWVYGKGGVAWHADRVWALSGTPCPNHAGEIWALAYTFGLTKLSYPDFLARYCYVDWITDRVLGNRRELMPELMGIIKPIMLRRTRDQVMPQFKDILTFNQWNVNPLRGIDLNSDDPMLVDPESRKEVALAKVPQMVEEITGNFTAGNYRKTVVFAWHIDPMEKLVADLRKNGIPAAAIMGKTSTSARKQIQANMHGNGHGVVVIQIIVGGTAIDASFAQHGYFLELDYVPGNNEQAAHRLVNYQTGLPVTMDVMTWPGSKDSAVQRTIMRKVKGALFD